MMAAKEEEKGRLGRGEDRRRRGAGRCNIHANILIIQKTLNKN